MRSFLAWNSFIPGTRCRKGKILQTMEICRSRLKECSWYPNLTAGENHLESLFNIHIFVFSCRDYDPLGLVKFLESIFLQGLHVSLKQLVDGWYLGAG